MSESTLTQFVKNEINHKSLNNSSTMTENSLKSPRKKVENSSQSFTLLTRKVKSKSIKFPKEVSLKSILSKNITQGEKNSTSNFLLYSKSKNIDCNLYNRNKSSIINSKSKNENVLITSLFTLPSLNKNDNKTISCSQIISHNKEKAKNLKTLNKKIQDFPNISRNNDPLIRYAISQTDKKSVRGEEVCKSFDRANKRNKENLKLENYMREKFYEDIEKKMEFKFKNKNFCHDHSVKDRLIQMNQVGLFWGGVFEYCNPLICVKKFKYVKENLFRERLLKAKLNNYIINDDELDYYNLKKIKIQKPILYTNNLRDEIRHPEKNN